MQSLRHKARRMLVFTLRLSPFLAIISEKIEMQSKPTMVHRSIDQVSIVSLASVPSSQRQRRQPPGLCVIIHALYDQHMVLEMLAAIGMPLLSPLTASRHTLKVTTDNN